MTLTKRTIDVVRVQGARRATAADCAAVEEPLEIRLHGRPFAVIMRTPGADRELAAGFLFSERVVTNPDGFGTIERCRDRAEDASRETPRETLRENVVNVTLTDPTALDRAFAGQRQVMTGSSCGLCGRRSIESLAVDVAPLSASWKMHAVSFATLAGRLREAQAVFDETGGLHAAGLFTPTGDLVDVAEDVGRHNAVDKVVGRRLMQEMWPVSDLALFVSGRSSFEILQKALLAGIPIVAAVSAPSTLAIDLAHEMGITLVGFVRGERFNIYTHSERITS
ncbi:MAG TPA: formate dehydrogenase accessory sulfurtransferase FdhD [Vicinamibacterales bacterium]|jgi:FdhD protein|nr:formate dehydrogenase accessory sulfurtransferase FdhD [Vicinamibacterales bacterium]